MTKYFTIVIRADDEKAARSLVPGEIIRGNIITACSLGDALTLNEKIKNLVPAEKEKDLSALEHADLFPFFG